MGAGVGDGSTNIGPNNGPNIPAHVLPDAFSYKDPDFGADDEPKRRTHRWTELEPFGNADAWADAIADRRADV